MFARDAVVTTPMESLVWGVSPIWMESQKVALGLKLIGCSNVLMDVYVLSP